MQYSSTLTIKFCSMPHTLIPSHPPPSPPSPPSQKQLVVPGEKVVAELTEVFQRMMKTYCAISKLEYLLEAVRLTYENVMTCS